MTLEELLQHFKTQHNIDLTMVASGLSLIYAPHLIKKRHSRKRNATKVRQSGTSRLCFSRNRLEFCSRISEIYETVTKSKVPEHVRSLVLDVMGDDPEGNDIDDLPYLKYTFRHADQEMVDS